MAWTCSVSVFQRLYPYHRIHFYKDTQQKYKEMLRKIPYFPCYWTSFAALWNCWYILRNQSTIGVFRISPPNTYRPSFCSGFLARSSGEYVMKVRLLHEQAGWYYPICLTVVEYVRLKMSKVRGVEPWLVFQPSCLGNMSWKCAWKSSPSLPYHTCWTM